jgi:1-acyl-sn-glycerol-3-phosphate acyltransferase
MSALKYFKTNKFVAGLRMIGVVLLIFASGCLSLIIFQKYAQSWWILHLRKKLYQGIRFCTGIRTRVQGTPERQAVFAVSNHISYLDIILLGEHVPYTFVAKQEVTQWPWIGWVATKLGTIFIHRSLRGIHKGQQKITEALTHQHAVLVFAEGTTGNGIITEPFYSAFFELPQGTCIQPISITYTDIKGLPTLSCIRRELGWIGENGMMPHLWNLLRWHSLTVVLTFHRPFHATCQRKQDTLHAENLVRAGISNNF